MTKQTGNDRYAGTTPQSTQQQSQGQSQKQSQSVNRLQGEAVRPAPEQAGSPEPDQPQAGGSQYEINTPQKMPHDENEEARRQQAGEQSDHNPDEKGFGYGAQDGEEMADAPDASERGYGGAAKEREEKLNESE